MTTENLLPCPFCETQPIWINETLSDGHYYIKCPHCQFTMKQDRRDKVIGFWNTRPQSSHKHVVSGKQPTTQEIEALAQVALEDAIPGNIAMWADDSEEREYYKIVWKRGFTAALSTVAGVCSGEDKTT